MKFGKSVVITLMTSIITFFMSFIISVIISRNLGANGTGIIGLSNNLITLFLIVLDLGIGASSTYFVGKYKDKVNKIIGTQFLLFFIEIIILVFVYIVQLHFKLSIFKGLNNNIIIISFLMIPINGLNTAFTNVILSLQEFEKYNIIILLTKVVNILLISVFVVLFRSSFHVILANLFTNIVVLIVQIYILFYEKSFKISIELSFVKSMISYGIRLQMSNLVQLLTYRLDVFIINYFLLTRDVGIYNNAVQLAEAMWQIPGTIAILLYPVVSNHSENSIIKNITNKTMRISFTFIILCSIILGFISKPIILLLYGKEFEQAAVALVLLIPGICIFSISKILCSSLSGMGKVNINLGVSVFSCVVTVILDVILIPSIGINGASIATSISYFAHAIVTLILYCKITGSSIREVLILEKNDLNEITAKIKSKLFA